MRAFVSLLSPPTMTVGEKVVGLYFLAFYLGPLVANIVFRDNITSIYSIYPLTPTTLCSLAGCFLLFHLGARRFSRWHLPAPPVALRHAVHFFGRTYLRLRLVLALGALILGCKARWLGLNSYRYADSSAGELNYPEIFLMIFATAVILADLVGVLFATRQAAPAALSRRGIENRLLAISFILMANGTVTLLLGLLVAFGCFAPRAFRQLFFLPAAASLFSFASLRKIALSVFVVVGAFLLAWIGGETIKSRSVLLRTGPAEMANTLAPGAPAASPRTRNAPPRKPLPGRDVTLASTFKERISRAGFFRQYPFYFAESISVYYYTLLFTEGAPREVLKNSEPTVLVYPLRSLLFRLDHLTGGHFGVPRPAIGSLMRLNYELLTEGPINQRAGSSPGLLGSFNYVFPWPLGVVFAALYLVLVKWLLDVNFAEPAEQSLSPVGSMLLLVFLHGLFQSPFDLLIVLDDGFVFFACLVGAALYRAQSGLPPAIVGAPAAEPGGS